MTLSIIVLIVFVVCLTAGFIITYKPFKKRRKKSDKDFFNSYSNEVGLRSLDREVSRLSKEVQPLIDKHKEEGKQKLIETRKAHWKSFNKWKSHKGMLNKEGDNRPVCGDCLNDSLELTVEYKELVEKSMYGFGGYHMKKDYPISAELKCTVCNHVADKWEYKEWPYSWHY